ncbi:MAG: hypothetical protein JF616_12560 [Fibrobacteres bacterium]|nr:hypothetical protein [Fibrobacterota bacterium]
MSLKMKWISAALALGALIACMKAGDGVGLDTAGRVCTDDSKDSACLPYINPCTANPSLPSCQVDPCLANPASKVCSTSVCAKDPTKPWCQSVDCATTPTAQVCVDSCLAHPALAWCAVKTDCATTPTAQICVDSCKTHPALAWCKVDCTVNPTDPSCGPVKTKFSEVYAIITASTCLQCHAPGQVGVTTGKLDMSSSDAAYANLVGVPVADQALAPGWVRVLAGKPDSSMLYLKVTAAPTGFQPKLPNGTAYHDAMPLTGAPLTKAKLDLIKKWITDGAVK